MFTYKNVHVFHSVQVLRLFLGLFTPCKSNHQTTGPLHICVLASCFLSILAHSKSVAHGSDCCETKIDLERRLTVPHASYETVGERDLGCHRNTRGKKPDVEENCHQLPFVPQRQVRSKQFGAGGVVCNQKFKVSCGTVDSVMYLYKKETMRFLQVWQRKWCWE